MLKELQKKYPDAVKSKITVEKRVYKTVNLYKDTELRKYLQPFFPESSILQCDCSGRVVTAITSEQAYPEEQRQLSMVPGTKVIMTGAEAEIENLKDKVFEIKAGPQMMCGELVVWLDGYSGAYCCEYLKIVESSHED
ncbi:hypothetical protein IR083_10015 [Dysgonomonas sp. GY75]|uniref:hypothetical protein n=1 Tax=Dysgonomonas sp. GY75 TaxID=2780419 RepID=UPI0018845F7A|nr:hypothetical protein [Dysgonomonas sp. GY75]MBF0649155.1 hypothetical protein [Dysgonomonas sp. GY75]